MTQHIGTTSTHGAVIVLAFAVAGIVGGTLARLLLARMRRGTRVRAPGCEAAVGTLWGVTGGAWAAGLVAGVWVPALLGLGWLGVAAAVVDVRHHRLPDALTVPALPVAVLLLVPLGAAAMVRGAVGAAVAVAAHALVHLVSPLAMGAGDVKLAGPVGAVLGGSSWSALVLAAGLAAVLSAAVAVVGLASGRLRRGDGVPHGPSMLVAAWLVVAGAAAGAGAG